MPRNALHDYPRALRFQKWTKNVLAFLPLVLATASLCGVAESRLFRFALAGLCAIGLVYAALSQFYINAR